MSVRWIRPACEACTFHTNSLLSKTTEKVSLVYLRGMCVLHLFLYIMSDFLCALRSLVYSRHTYIHTYIHTTLLLDSDFPIRFINTCTYITACSLMPSRAGDFRWPWLLGPSNGPCLLPSFVLSPLSALVSSSYPYTPYLCMLSRTSLCLSLSLSLCVRANNGCHVSCKVFLEWQALLRR